MLSYLEVLAQPNRPKIGLVLSSGGIKPFAAFELFKFLEEARIPIDLLVGCSGGGIASMMKAIGLSIDEMKQNASSLLKPELFKLDYHTVSSLLHVPFTRFKKGHGLFKGAEVLKSIGKVAGNRMLEELNIPTILQTTSLETGLGVVQTKGKLAELVYASAAVVPFLPPIEIQGKWYVDGGYSDAFPVIQAVARGMDIIIAMDFQSGVKLKPAKNYYESFEHLSLSCIQNEVHYANSCAVDVHSYEIIFMEVDFEIAVPMWHTDALPYVFERGKVAVEGVKQQIIQAIELFPAFQANAAGSI